VKKKLYLSNKVVNMPTLLFEFSSNYNEIAVTISFIYYNQLSTMNKYINIAV